MSHDPLDAVIAAAEFHILLLENDAVRVLETRIAPGQTVPLHTHRWPAVHHILSRGEMVRRDAAGDVTYDSRRSPPVYGPVVWSGPIGPHTLENVGGTAIHIVTVEIKR